MQYFILFIAPFGLDEVGGVLSSNIKNARSSRMGHLKNLLN